LEAFYPETRYLSKLLARKILSAEGKVLGKALDLIVDMDQPQPQVVMLVFRHSWSLERWCVNWSDVGSVEQAGIRLKAGTIPTPLTT
jgi:sporulation protein YlmC with PRC-barrel domain